MSCIYTALDDNTKIDRDSLKYLLSNQDTMILYIEKT